ncbi:glycosyltransferase family 2 protein [Spongisporangium articulatum]|uniref:Glycosyltransferase family 2 protein n=1 Tax=Spongisporangium articulatum TaxID=3362603 RepID=A0ABW8AT98_9ACTN
MSTSGARVVVAVLTYKRPQTLAALLPVLGAQCAEVPDSASVLVVDNDPAASARDLVSANGFAYEHEATPGISAARNRALEVALERGFDVLVFIDDDELPVPGWLSSLLTTWRSTGADGVVGQVESEFEGTLDPWIAAGGFFTRRRLPTGTPVTVAATNNLLLCLPAVAARGLRFDERLGLIGGEDTLFTRTLTGTGGTLVWCAEASVTDVVPAARMTRKFVVQRAFRYGATATRVEVALASGVAGRLVVRLRQTATAATRLAAGLARLALGTVTFSPGRRAAGVRNLARGCGLLSGLVGYVPSQYAR